MFCQILWRCRSDCVPLRKGKFWFGRNLLHVTCWMILFCNKCMLASVIFTWSVLLQVTTHVWFTHDHMKQFNSQSIVTSCKFWFNQKLPYVTQFIVSLLVPQSTLKWFSCESPSNSMKLYFLSGLILFSCWPSDIHNLLKETIFY